MVATQLDEETVKKIIRQVEFYFSDSNLPRDNFLKNAIAESDDGMVSIALICSFSRMRGHLGLEEIKAEDVSDDTVEAVAETLKAKSTSLKISQDGKKVGRTTEIPKSEEQLDGRTIAASPFQYDINLEDIESFFGQSAKVNSVRLPRHVSDKRVFSGTALVEFSSEEEATQILTQTLLFRGAQLELKPKKEFDEQRAKEEEAENTRRDMLANRKNGSQEELEDYPKGLIVAFKLKRMSSENDIDAKSSDVKPDSIELVTESIKEGSEPKADVKPTDIDAKSSDVKPESMELVTESIKEGSEPKADVKPTDIDAKASDVKPDSMELVSESIKEDSEPKADVKPTDIDAKSSDVKPDSMELVTESIKEDSEPKSDVKPTDSEEAEEDKKKSPLNDKKKTSADKYKDNNDVVLREDLKSVFQKFGTVKFIDFKMGEESGYIRFEEADGAHKSRAAAVLTEEGGLIVKNYVAILDPVTGEAEKEYWNMLRSQEKSRGNKSNWSRGGKNNRGGRHFNGKHNRSRDNNSGNRQNKFQKVAAA